MNEWPNLLADLRRKRDGLNEVIAILEHNFGGPDISEAGAMELPQPRRPSTRKVKAAKARATSERQTEPDVITQKILEQLRKNGPMTPGELTAAVKADKIKIRRRVKQLAAIGRVTLSGVTASRLIHLGIAKASTSAPKPNGSMKPAASEPSRSSLAEVEERDRAVLLRIKGAGHAGRSIRELMITLEQSEGALIGSIDRLRIKKQIQDAGGGKWISA